jgi:hydrogenase nickel incorporation protein HypA/HybF
MHEWALAEGVIATSLEAAEKEGLTTIRRIVVKIGELQRINPEVFQDALDSVVPPADSRLISTAFELELEPVRFECRPCRHRFGADETTTVLTENESEAIHFIPELAHSFLSCPQCHSPDFQVIRGRGVWIESVEGD